MNNFDWVTHKAEIHEFITEITAAHPEYTRQARERADQYNNETICPCPICKTPLTFTHVFSALNPILKDPKHDRDCVVKCDKCGHYDMFTSQKWELLTEAKRKVYEDHKDFQNAERAAHKATRKRK